jgi:GT2 family glycosyltransferase
LFLHVDVELPAGWQAGIQAALADPRVVGGGFLIRADPASVSLNVITCLSNFRSRVRRSFYGDQAIFVRAPAFREIGGFDESLPLFEGYDLTRRLPRVGALACVPRQVRASSRRFIEGGVWRIFMTFHYLKLRYLLGFLPVDTDVLYPIQAGR